MTETFFFFFDESIIITFKCIKFTALLDVLSKKKKKIEKDVWVGDTIKDVLERRRPCFSMEITLYKCTHVNENCVYIVGERVALERSQIRSEVIGWKTNQDKSEKQRESSRVVYRGCFTHVEQSTRLCSFPCCRHGGRRHNRRLWTSESSCRFAENTIFRRVRTPKTLAGEKFRRVAQLGPTWYSLWYSLSLVSGSFIDFCFNFCDNSFTGNHEKPHSTNSSNVSYMNLYWFWFRIRGSKKSMKSIYFFICITYWSLKYRYISIIVRN